MLFDLEWENFGTIEQIRGAGLLPGLSLTEISGDQHFSDVLMGIGLDPDAWKDEKPTLAVLMLAKEPFCNQDWVAAWVISEVGPELVFSNKALYTENLPRFDAKAQFAGRTYSEGIIDIELGQSLERSWILSVRFMVERDHENEQPENMGVFSDYMDKDYVTLPAPEWSDKEYFVTPYEIDEFGGDPAEVLEFTIKQGMKLLERWESFNSGFLFYGTLSCQIVLTHKWNHSAFEKEEILGSDAIGGVENDTLADWAGQLWPRAWEEVNKERLGLIVA